LCGVRLTAENFSLPARPIKTKSKALRLHLSALISLFSSVVLGMEMEMEMVMEAIRKAARLERIRSIDAERVAKRTLSDALGVSVSDTLSAIIDESCEAFRRAQD
jgi:hypothetical protein